jgi:uncharacterized protein with HEPN domain
MDNRWKLRRGYRRANQIDPGVETWAELVGYRNRLAHALPGDLSSDRIWADTTTDLEPILADLHRLR